jgi:hypothetical protein
MRRAPTKHKRDSSSTVAPRPAKVDCQVLYPSSKERYHGVGGQHVGIRTEERDGWYGGEFLPSMSSVKYLRNQLVLTILKTYYP